MHISDIIGLVFAILTGYGVYINSFIMVLICGFALLLYVAYKLGNFIFNKIDERAKKQLEIYESQIPLDYEATVDKLYERYKNNETEKYYADVLIKNFNIVGEKITKLKKSQEGIQYLVVSSSWVYRVFPDNIVQEYDWKTNDWKDTTRSMNSVSMDEIKTEEEAYKFITEKLHDPKKS